MKNSNQFKGFSLAEKSLIEKMLPWGLVNLKAIVSENGNEIRSKNRTAQSLTQKGITENKILSYGSKKSQTTSRLVLTKQAMPLVIDSLRSEPALAGMSRDNVSLRTGKNIQQVSKLISLSDAQTFLKSAGVATIYDAIVYHKENPFIFGAANLLRRKSLDAFSDRCIANLLDYAYENKQLRHPVEMKDMVLFLPSNCNGLCQRLDIHDSILKFYNNMTGLLLDFRHMFIYCIFKSTDRENFFWQEKAYQSFHSNMFSDLKRYGFRNISSAGIDSAFILCETKKEYESKIQEYNRAVKPFTHVIPVLMKQEGVSYFRDVIGHGRKQQRHLYYREAKAQIQNVTNQRETEFTALTYKGENLYVGTLPDLVLSNFLFQQCVMNRSPYVACYNWQVPYYQDELHVPPEKLIVIEDLGPKTEIATN
jgi:hypothetical protein